MEEKAKNNMENKCLCCGVELPAEKRSELYCSLSCKKVDSIDLSTLSELENLNAIGDKPHPEPIKIKGIVDYLPEIIETVNKCAVLFAPPKKKKKKKEEEEKNI